MFREQLTCKRSTLFDNLLSHVAQRRFLDLCSLATLNRVTAGTSSRLPTLDLCTYRSAGWIQRNLLFCFVLTASMGTISGFQSTQYICMSYIMTHAISRFLRIPTITCSSPGSNVITDHHLRYGTRSFIDQWRLLVDG